MSKPEIRQFPIEKRGETFFDRFAFLKVYALIIMLTLYFQLKLLSKCNFQRKIYRWLLEKYLVSDSPQGMEHKSRHCNFSCDRKGNPFDISLYYGEHFSILGATMTSV